MHLTPSFSLPCPSLQIPRLSTLALECMSLPLCGQCFCVYSYCQNPPYEKSPCWTMDHFACEAQLTSATGPFCRSGDVLTGVMVRCEGERLSCGYVGDVLSVSHYLSIHALLPLLVLHPPDKRRLTIHPQNCVPKVRYPTFLPPCPLRCLPLSHSQSQSHLTIAFRDVILYAKSVVLFS